ncbi:MAG: DUF2333 family protein [Pseudomonadales bacterium]|nr:DUF2333 family protein [Pseudomonadales bacterium]
MAAIGVTGFLWDAEPATFDVNQVTERETRQAGVNSVRGSTTVATTIELASILLNKRGGYLTNDLMPPGAWMDNVPNWEFGVLVQIRDMARTLRNNLSRSQSQSTEDEGLVNAENQFYFDNDKWILPESEDEYRKGIHALRDYLQRLGDTEQQSAQFYARADNLRTWLSEVETRLGSLSQRLSASIGKRQLDTSLAGDSAATQSTATRNEIEVKTPWTELDDVFYEARGTTWALIHLLKAIEVDFRDVLEKKNALVSLQQIIRELEPTQQTLWSPVILNGDGMGILANHSLVMGSHISRANAAIIDLRRLLSEG